MRSRVGIAVGAAIIVVLAACGGSGDEDEEASSTRQDASDISGSVTMWIPPIAGDLESTYWPDKVQQFKATYPGIDVEVVVVPWENRPERFTTAIAGGSAPDVAYLIPDELAGYADQGILTDVTDVVADDREDFRSSALAALSLRGDLFGVPTLMNVTTTMYSQKALDAIGLEEPPGTWDEVREAAPTALAAGYYITQYEGALTMTLNGSFYPLLWQAGGAILNEDNSAAAFNGPEGLEALEFAVWLADNGYTPKDSLTTQLPVETSPLAQGEVAMLFSRSLASARQSGLADDDIVLAPPLEGKASVSYGTVGGYSVFKSSNDQAAAIAWVDWITSADHLREFLPPRDALSPRISVTDLYDSSSLTGQTEQFLDSMTTGLVHPNGRAIMDLIKPHLQAALLGQVDPQQALDDAADDVNDLLARS